MTDQQPTPARSEGDHFGDDEEPAGALDPYAAATSANDTQQAVGDPIDSDLPLSWRNLGLLALTRLPPSENADLFDQLHQLVLQDSKRSVLWIAKPAGDGQWMYLAKNVQNNQTLVTSELLERRDHTIDMAHWFADPRGSRVVGPDGIDL